MAASLSDEQNDRLREALRALVAQEGGNVSKTARRLGGVSQSWVSRFLTSQLGGSMQTAALIARELNVPVENLLSDGSRKDKNAWRAAASGVELRPPKPSRKTLPTWSEIPGFEAALISAKQVSNYNDRVWYRVARLHTGVPPEEITPIMLIKAAEMIAITYADKISSGSDAPPPSRAGNHGKSVRRLRRGGK